MAYGLGRPLIHEATPSQEEGSTFRQRLESAANNIALYGIEFIGGLGAAALTGDSGFGRQFGRQARLMMEPDPRVYLSSADVVETSVALATAAITGTPDFATRVGQEARVRHELLSAENDSGTSDCEP